MPNPVGQKMSDYPLLSTLTQEERETYMQNVAMTTFGTKDNTGTKINVNVPLSAIVPTVPVTDVTVGGTSVVSGGVAAVPGIPDAASLADGTSITASNGKLSASIPVTDVTVGNNTVVENGVAIIPKYYGQNPIMNTGYNFSLSYNNDQFELAGTNNTELTLTNPVPAPNVDHSDQGKVLSVNDSDQVVWAQPSASVAISQYNGDVSTVSAVNAASSGGYVFSLNIDSETLEEQHDDVAGKKYVTVKNPLPSTDGASDGAVLTITSGQVGWAPAQGGGGGNPYTKVSVTPGTSYPNGKKSEYDTNLFDQDVNISNNTYSVLSTEIGYDSTKSYPDSQAIDVFKIKLPANTDFPMAVVEFQLKTGEDASVNKVEVYVGDTKLTQVKDAPYNDDVAMVNVDESDNEYYIHAKSITDATTAPQKIINLWQSGVARYRTAMVNNKFNQIYVKVQVHIFGSCFKVMTSHPAAEIPAS